MLDQGAKIRSKKFLTKSLPLPTFTCLPANKGWWLQHHLVLKNMQSAVPPP